jgi:hypothetical protein
MRIVACDVETRLIRVIKVWDKIAVKKVDEG